MAVTRAKQGNDTVAREIRSEAGLIIHRAELSGFREAWFEPQYWIDQNRAERIGTGRGANWFVMADEGAWVLRHYRRGGTVARLSADAYLFTGSSATRSVREWRLLARLSDAGLPVPRPVAARVRRRGLFYRADIITERLAGTATFSHELAAASLDDTAMAAAGRCIRQLHDAGVWHADLNAHNLLLRDDGAVFIIDFDRARERNGGLWKRGNLRRLRRSFDKLSPGGRFDEQRWAALVQAYEHGPAPVRQ